MYNHTVNTQVPQQKFPREAQPQLLYKQSFQCTCSRIFNSLDEYNYHIENQNHDYLQSYPNDSGREPQFQLNYAQIQQNNPLIETQNPNQYPNRNSNQQFFSNLNDLNIYDQRSPQNSTFFDRKSYQYPNNYVQKPIFDSYHQQFTRQSQVQQKQESFKYIQAYYAQKMAPYYRQFDVDPQKPFSNKKSTYQNKNSFSRNLKIQQNSSKFTRSQSTTDLNKILEELGVRMIPVENGIVDFIYIFTTQNFQKITQLKEGDIQKIQKKLQESVNQLSMICFQNKKSVSKDNLFMDSDIDFIIRTFIEFLKEILRHNQLWIGYMMLTPIIKGILKFCQEKKDHFDGNLRLTDFPFILSSLKINELSNSQDLPLRIETDQIIQFLIWFTQWFTMVQLIKSKWNIDYIEPFYDQIHCINRVYQDNVNKYRKCVVQKQVQHGRRYKRKMIEKQRQKQRFYRNVRREFKNLKYYRNSFDTMQNFENLNNKRGSKPQRQHLNDRKSNHVDPSFNNQGENTQYNKLANSQFDANNRAKLKQNQRNFTQTSEINDILYKQLQQKSYQENLRKRNYRNILESQYLKSHTNNFDANQREDSEDDEMKEVYNAAFNSQYVSYFSPESQQARKKEEQKWAVKVQKLKEIIKNPQLLKKQMFKLVSKQIQQVNELTGPIKIDLRLYNHYIQKITKICNKSIKENILIQKINNTQSNNQKEQVIQTKKPSIYVDPFIIKKNYRFRNNYLTHFNKSQFEPKYPMESSQNDIKNQQQINNNKFYFNQKINEFNNTKKAQQNQIKRLQLKQKNSINLQNEIKKGISYAREDSNDFLDDLL